MLGFPKRECVIQTKSQWLPLGDPVQGTFMTSGHSYITFLTLWSGSFWRMYRDWALRDECAQCLSFPQDDCSAGRGAGFPIIQRVCWFKSRSIWVSRCVAKQDPSPTHCFVWTQKDVGRSQKEQNGCQCVIAEWINDFDAKNFGFKFNSINYYFTFEG